jgi:uncharacterized repeat protein (TIGR01451 family)
MTPLDLFWENVLEIIDPDGIKIDKQNIVSDVEYHLIDINADGEKDNLIALNQFKQGSYMINVIPKAEAKPTDNYTLAIWTKNSFILLADRIAISDIPSEPYIFQVNGDELIRPSIFVEKIADSVIGVPGSIINFTIKIINSGDSTLKDIRANDYLPKGLTFISDSSNGSINDRNITWSNLGSLTIGDAIVISLNASIDKNATGLHP